MMSGSGSGYGLKGILSALTAPELTCSARVRILQLCQQCPSASPARFVSAYSPDVSPQDFHALTEVYLEGGWHLVDPTAMAKPESTVRIGVGADAADVAFMTSFAPMQCVAQSVRVSV